MKKAEILEQIRQIALADGRPPGRQHFFNVTGIKETDWSGRFWARWSDAVVEAGFEPNLMQPSFEDDVILDHLIELIQELGKFPTRAELKLRRRSDPSFPSPNVFSRLGRKSELAGLVLQRCAERGDAESVAEICRPISRSDPAKSAVESSSTAVGSVYLIKSGRHYKIGRSNAVGRREYELGLVLPEPVKTIHVISTDDPAGVEAYWHRRFDALRRRGEWFELSADDIAAFKRWKTIV